MQQADGVLATASTLETAAAVRTGAVSAVETTEAAVATGANPPLAGVPVTVKAKMPRLELVENGGTKCV
jgi:hypothetical protein